MADAMAREEQDFLPSFQDDEAMRPDDGREMPIRVSDALNRRVRSGERIVTVRAIPWAMLAHDDAAAMAKLNHNGQSLERLAARGGVSADEAIFLIAGMTLYEASLKETAAHRILYAMRTMFHRGKLYA